MALTLLSCQQLFGKNFVSDEGMIHFTVVELAPDLGYLVILDSVLISTGSSDAWLSTNNSDSPVLTTPRCDHGLSAFSIRVKVRRATSCSATASTKLVFHMIVIRTLIFISTNAHVSHKRHWGNLGSFQDFHKSTVTTFRADPTPMISKKTPFKKCVLIIHMHRILLSNIGTAMKVTVDLLFQAWAWRYSSCKAILSIFFACHCSNGHPQRVVATAQCIYWLTCTCVCFCCVFLFFWILLRNM